MIAQWIKKHKLKKAKRMLENINDLNRRNTLVEIVKMLGWKYLIPDTDTKYVPINPYYRSIKQYNRFIAENLLNYDFSKQLPKHLFNIEEKSVYYIDFFINGNEVVNIEEELELFIEAYLQLSEILTMMDITDGVLYFNSKVINFYLTNMDKIIYQILSAKLSR